MASDDFYMRRALDLARAGIGLVSPNPAVGAVVVDKAGTEVGAGTHIYDGVKHAEVLALEQAGERARGGTLYLNLEPCSHQGRTGPCANAVIAAGVKRVVCSLQDPNPQVAGRGFRKLREAGITVEVGAFAAEAKKLNEQFAVYMRHSRPFVTLKSAMSLDGKIARSGRAQGAPSLASGAPSLSLRSLERQPGAPSLSLRSLERQGGPAPQPQGVFTRSDADTDSHRREWMTGETARADVQRLRHEHDAILAGIGTILADNPLLTDRSGLPRRRKLLRIVLDSHLRTPLNSRLVETANDDVLIVYSSAEDDRKRSLEAKGIRLEQIPGDAAGQIDFRELLQRLRQMEITSLLVEGGARVNGSALSSGEVDKVFLYFAPKIFGDGVPFACGQFNEIATLPRDLRSAEFHRFGSDFAIEGYLRDPYEA